MKPWCPVKRFFTADPHFGHILRYEAQNRCDAYGRPLASIDHRDTYLVDQWNAAVATGDLVYCLGDFSYKLHAMHAILPYLNGAKVLIVGNHDPFFKNRASRNEVARANAINHALHAGFSAVFMQWEIDLPGVGAVRLCHFPYAPPASVDTPAYDLRYLAYRPLPGPEKALLHGHVHSQWKTRIDPGQPLMLNVGVDVWGMRPVSEAEIIATLKEGLC